MKNYNVIKEEMQFPWGAMDVIALGEEGRGREILYIPFHAGDAALLQVGQTRSNAPKIIASQSEDGWLARISCKGCYTRGTYGTVYVPIEQKNNICIIAYGYGAYGDAGRIGEWYDFLCTIQDGTLVKVRPSGGSGKSPRYWLYFGNKEVSRINTEEMDLFCEQAGLNRPPEEFDNLIDFNDINL